jgi:aspartate kinase
MFRALADAKVNIEMISTSEIKISVLVARDDGLNALRTVHAAFQLDKEPHGAQPSPHEAHRARNGDATAVVARLQGMEDLTITDIRLDETQARVTISGVPDSPGIAAAVFEHIASAGIFVDMIVQSYGRGGRANLSFTVPHTAFDKSIVAAKDVGQRLGCGPASGSPRVAKLSVSGIGMRSHTGVAIRMFKALAEAGINLEMINTSEVRVNVVVDGAAGHEALKRLQDAFADAQR